MQSSQQKFDDASVEFRRQAEEAGLLVEWHGEDKKAADLGRGWALLATPWERHRLKGAAVGRLYMMIVNEEQRVDRNLASRPGEPEEPEDEELYQVAEKIADEIGSEFLTMSVAIDRRWEELDFVKIFIQSAVQTIALFKLYASEGGQLSDEEQKKEEERVKREQFYLMHRPGETAINA